MAYLLDCPIWFLAVPQSPPTLAGCSLRSSTSLTPINHDHRLPPNHAKIHQTNSPSTMQKPTALGTSFKHENRKTTSFNISLVDERKSTLEALVSTNNSRNHPVATSHLRRSELPGPRASGTFLGKNNRIRKTGSGSPPRAPRWCYVVTGWINTQSEG